MFQAASCQRFTSSALGLLTPASLKMLVGVFCAVKIALALSPTLSSAKTRFSSADALSSAGDEAWDRSTRRHEIARGLQCLLERRAVQADLRRASASGETTELDRIETWADD